MIARRPLAQRLGFLLVLLVHAVFFGAANASGEDAVWKKLREGGHVVLVRHAQTVPGTGDPPGFRLEDCATQRNLSEAGRAQARRLGAVFRKRNVPVARVVSSPWCRCVETARLMFGREPATDGSLANLHGRPENAGPQKAGFRELIAEPPKGGNLVLVTHGSTTVALTGEYPQMGEAIVVTPTGRGEFRVLGRIR